ncbi:MAG: trypsin-like peptidase domain-containing protein [Planctomycetota bacterium]
MPLRPLVVAVCLFLSVLTAAAPARAQERTAPPENAADLRAIEAKVTAAVRRALPATVAINARGTFGSGVVVSADGYVLTAGHVSTEPGRRVRVIFQDGHTVQGETLGWGQREDLGLIKIIDKNDDKDWPYLEMGNAAEFQRGDWCIALGHPGGHEHGRAPVVRTGRLLSTARRMLRTDCAIASGDSGGPLLDLSGRVVGIHSRINPDITRNYHVPIDLFQDSWTRLTSAETWGRSMIGVRGVDHEKGYRITEVIAGYPAEKSGLEVGDVVTKVQDQEVTDFDVLARVITRLSAGTTVKLSVLRGEKTLSIEVTVANRREAQ